MYKRKRVSFTHVKEHGCLGCKGYKDATVCFSLIESYGACISQGKENKLRYYIFIEKEKKEFRNAKH